MEAVAQTLAVELAPLRVNVVTPGYVDTELWSSLPANVRRRTFREAAACWCSPAHDLTPP